MGTLLGHMLPGGLFFVFGMWCSCNILHRYYICRKEALYSGRAAKHSGRYRSTLLFPCSNGKWCLRSRPVDGVLFVIASAVGLFGEIANHNMRGWALHPGNWQHVTMYFFFGIMGITNVLLYYRFALPPDLDYLTALLALFIEGFLFLYHLHSRTPMDIQVHLFLVYAIALCGLATALEMVHKTNVLAALSRAFGFVLQGTWFMQMGFILYPPSFLGAWNPESHDQMMIVTMLFAWHFAAVFILFTIVGILINIRVKFMSRQSVYNSMNMKITGKLNGSAVNGKGLVNGHIEVERTRMLLLSESEDDVL